MERFKTFLDGRPYLDNKSDFKNLFQSLLYVFVV